MKNKLNCVLLVDDDEATNFLNTEFLEESGITENIAVAMNGVEAIDYLTSTGRFNNGATINPAPDLILLDINMPVMDGWEFIKAYRGLKKEQRGKIIIAMLTTSLNPNDQLKAQEISEISAYKTKPLSFEIIDEIMRTNFPEYL